MATQKKAPAKRKATKTRARKATSPKNEAGPVIEPVEPEYNSPQWAAKVQAYTTLKNAELPVPKEIATPVETWLEKERLRTDAERAAQETEAQKVAQEDEAGPKWVRNLLTSPFNIRLQRQDKKQRIELKPRGVRGDMFPLEPGDENDHVLRSNIGYVEIIGDGTARKHAEKQTHNIQKTNTVLAQITNELGEPIDKLTVATEYNKQGVTVAYVDPNSQEKLEKGEFGKSRTPLGDLSRQPEQVAHWVPTGGNPAIVSQGFTQGGPQMTPDAQLAVADKLARIKGQQGRPEDVLNLSVSVDPVQSS